ncbi:CAP domain-containing protein [Dermabacter hominis]|uniref:CAP domain-containing protein n=1 Tax=Dermabacter hominis TaxID=36740 RepID=UPI0021A5220C|nr:CAP domain-containing protein [Dermabacter hominis]MCT1807374.1 CAP domain-containing protein [Dermabacter hominis]MCT2055642.1 CAP domain-containing protein [Dermabacter hominis]MCT2082876.1 CAP domain-containing protein [Dermabacter hominis]MCT2091875.1 CAP domain-containing protein [Dermabacter hominis]MCT2190498.1 CAP domain-containing protein [Dermabacter hominis]
MTFTRKKLGPVIGLGLSLSLLAACSGGSAANHAASRPSSSMSTSADPSSSASTSPSGTSGNEAGSGAGATESPQSGEDEDHSNESLAQRWARRKNRTSGQDASRIGEPGRSGMDNSSELNAGKAPSDGRGNAKSGFEITPDTALARGESDTPIPPAKTPDQNPTPAKDDPASKPAAPKPAHDNTDGGKNGTIVAAPEPKKPTDHRGDSGKPGKKPGKSDGTSRPERPSKPNKPKKTVIIAAFDEEGYNAALKDWNNNLHSARDTSARANAELDRARREAESSRAKAEESRAAYEQEKAKLDELIAAMPGDGDLAAKRDLAAKLKVEAEKAAADVKAADAKLATAQKAKQDADRKLDAATKQLAALSDKREKLEQDSSSVYSQLDEDKQLRALSDAVAERINAYRVKNGLNELVYAPVFNDEAAKWSTTMASSKELKHSNQDKAGYSGENVIQATCDLDASSVDECADNLFKKWHDSDADNANMLEERFSHAGLGLAKSDDGQVYGTNTFYLKEDARLANSDTREPKSKGMPENLGGEYVPEGAIAVTGGTKLAHTVDDRNTTEYDKWEGGKDGLDYTKGVRRGVDERISELEEAPRVDELKNLDSDISEAQANVDAAQAEADQSNQDLEDAKRAKGDADIRKTESEDASSKAQADLAEAEAAAPEADKARAEQQAKVDRQTKVVGKAETKASADNEAALEAETELKDAQAKADKAAEKESRVEADKPAEKDFKSYYELPAE